MAAMHVHEAIKKKLRMLRAEPRWTRFQHALVYQLSALVVLSDVFGCDVAEHLDVIDIGEFDVVRILWPDNYVYDINTRLTQVFWLYYFEGEGMVKLAQRLKVTRGRIHQMISRVIWSLRYNLAFFSPPMRPGGWLVAH